MSQVIDALSRGAARRAPAVRQQGHADVVLAMLGYASDRRVRARRAAAALIALFLMIVVWTLYG